VCEITTKQLSRQAGWTAAQRCRSFNLGRRTTVRLGVSEVRPLAIDSSAGFSRQQITKYTAAERPFLRLLLTAGRHFADPFAENSGDTPSEQPDPITLQFCARSVRRASQQQQAGPKRQIQGCCALLHLPNRQQRSGGRRSSSFP